MNEPGTEVTTVGETLPMVGGNTKAVLDIAIAASKSLKDVVAKKPHPVMIHGEQYLEYEDWQTLGQFYGYAVTTRDATPVEIHGIKGAKAKADLVDFRTGIIVGGAEAYCMTDEPRWADRPWHQLASMAQTRAGAKAFRNRLAWVAVLAGYKTTPAEEIQGEHQTTTGQKQRAQPEQALSGGISAPQNRKVQATCTEMKIDKDSYHAYLTAVFGRAHTNELTKKEASEVIEAVSEGQDRIDAELAKMMEE